MLDGKGSGQKASRSRTSFSTRAGGSLPGSSNRAGSQGSNIPGPFSPGRSGNSSWRQFPLLRVVVVPLLRSPHEIAMSLCTRSHGELGYWAALDLIAIHFGRMKAILKLENQATRAIGFGSSSFLDDLAEAATFCGISWNKENALRSVRPNVCPS